ncbi:MAG: hypothetical protein RLZZ179_5 [Verrucomicrobiota bacterium]
MRFIRISMISENQSGCCIVSGTNLGLVRLLVLAGLSQPLLAQTPDSSQFDFMTRPSRVPVRQAPAAHAAGAPAETASGIPLPDPALTGEGGAVTPNPLPGTVGDAQSASTEAPPAATEAPDIDISADSLFPEWLRFGIGIQSLYDSNIFLQSDNEEADWVNRVTPGITALFGERRTGSGTGSGSDWYGEARYTPAWTTYASNSDFNRFDHAGGIEGRLQQPLLTATAGLDYRENTANNRFTRDLFTTTTTRAYTGADYVLGPSTFLEGNLEWSRLERGDSLQDSNQRYNDEDTFMARAAALWQLSAATRLGPAVRYEQIDSSINADRDIVHTLVAINYNPQSIITLRGDVGAQWVSLDTGRTFWAPSARLSGLWDVDALWKIGFQAYSNSTAAPQGLDSTQQSTGLSADVSWVPDELLLVAAGLGYERASFEFHDSPSQDRDDDYFFGNLALRITPADSNLGFEVFYRYRFTNSSRENLDFSNSQAGVQLQYRF